MPSNNVDRAIRAPLANRAEGLLTTGEDQWYDRKSGRTRPADLARHLVAFANAEGGVIVVGFHNGAVDGVGYPLKEYQQIPIDHTTPPVRAQFERFEVLNAAGERAHVLAIRVDPGERVHELKNGECYLRVGDESRRLRYEDRKELEYDRGQAQFDGDICVGANLTALDNRLIDNYKERIRATLPMNRLLANRSLVTPQGQLTNAAILLFGIRPQTWYPQAYVRILRFLSDDRGSGSRLTVEEGSDLRIEGPIPRVIQQASREIERLVPRRRALAASGEFEPAPIVPRDAWLEGLVNAVIHRSYSLSGDHVRVEIYPSRIEIESPGRFPGLADSTRPLDISRFARNPRIARVCADLRIGQEIGEGIKRIFDEMRLRGLTDPVYVQKSGSVRLILRNVPRLDPKLAASLPKGSERIIDLLRAADNPLGTGDIAEALGMVRPTAQRRLKALQDAGLIVWVGKSPKDPRARWILAD